MVLMLDKRNKMREVVLGLGGNDGDVFNTLINAILKIEQQIGSVKLKSSLYKTKAWGVEDQPDFINMVIVVLTKSTPIEVLTNCLSIEKDLGREREGKKKWHQRIIDIDVLFYDNEIIETKELLIPHPHLQDRNFVLFPLAEILPNNIHPISKKVFSNLKIESKDTQKVLLLEDKI
jgi:2-amino-4-hydroxy-6-hydroxymethyldihydropteridine diphosphokinase